MQIIYQSQKSNLYSQVTIDNNLILINGQRKFKILQMDINNRTIDIQCQDNQKVLQKQLISNLIYNKNDIDLLVEIISNKHPEICILNK